jgi:hypothetical protein
MILCSNFYALYDITITYAKWLKYSYPIKCMDSLYDTASCDVRKITCSLYDTAYLYVLLSITIHPHIYINTNEIPINWCKHFVESETSENWFFGLCNCLGKLRVMQLLVPFTYICHALRLMAISSLSMSIL